MTTKTARRKQNHVIHALFPLLIFFIFVLSVLAVLVMSSNLYSKAVSGGADNFSDRTCFSYVAEKIHQNDNDGAVSIKKVDGTDCLVLSHKAENAGDYDYDTYIYLYNNNLKELSCLAGTDFSPEMGKDIAPLKALTMEEDDGLFLFEFVYPDDRCRRISVAERSES